MDGQTGNNVRESSAGGSKSATHSAAAFESPGGP